MYGFGGLGEVEVEIWSDVTIAGQRPTEQKGKIELLSQWTKDGWDEQLRILYVLYNILYMQPKKQLKVQYIGIFEEIDSFYWPKMHL